MHQLEKYFQTKKYLTYRPIPFWCWNDKLEKEVLLNQISWMNKKNIGGFFIHARSGLSTEYLSEEWMQCVKECAIEAKEQNMKAWIYDEDGWPSGFAGGKILENPENCNKYILASVGDFDSEAAVAYWLGEERLVRVQSSAYEGEYLNLYIHTSVSTADILNPKVVEQFLQLTHEAYKEQFGEQFSDYIQGFFTDEPQYYFNHTPYTDMIEMYFSEVHDEDIFDLLGLLFVEKEGYRKFRYQYYKGLQTLMLKNFAMQIYEWCEENGVMFTGHYMGENSLALQMKSCGGVMPFYEYEHIPGIDWLGKATESDLQVMQVASVAAQLGRNQVISEMYACCGWDVTPAELKRIAGFQYVNGVNLMCASLIPYTERGNRKHDYPAHYSDMNPWVGEGFADFNQYFTRLGFILGEGREEVKVAMLHPMRSAYFHYQYDAQNGAGVQELDDALTYANKLLKKNGVAFHYLDETLLEKHGFVEGNRIGCGKCSYEYLVLPKIYTMDVTTERLLRSYVENGGKVLLLDGMPAFLEWEEFDYAYLESNCTLGDILDAQLYKVKNTSECIYSTYRIMDDQKYLYVINASKAYEDSQTFDFGNKIKSFIRVDLLDMSTKRVPLTVTLQPGEDALLVPDERPIEEQAALTTYPLQFQGAEVSFEENALLVDVVRYSIDGKAYSKPWPCPALFQKLLKERYRGKLFLKYEFEIKKLPKRIWLKTENNNEENVWLNGIPMDEPLETAECYVNLYDITSKVRRGHNEYTVEVDWHESDDVYFALFGENVTENLINSIVYDSELEPIVLLGDFGVYTESGYKGTELGFVEGENFYIGEVPTKVSNLTVEGLPFFAGAVVLMQKVKFDCSNILLHLPGEYQMAEVAVNGKKAGRILFEKKIDISSLAIVGENEISVRFFISNRNLLGPHHCVGSKIKTVTPQSFEFLGKWEEDSCKEYHKSYDLKLFYEI
ncbi:MAG: hypothetical protein IJZ53_01700 [Tyzzerella sp.]|nr:hypothetical protein [Tyzzerella sp.]